MQEELFQFKMQKEEGIDYEEVFAPVARIEAIRPRVVNTARPRAINTARPRAINTARSRAVYTARPRAVNTARPNSAVVDAIRQIRLMLLRPQHVGFGDLPNLMGHPQKVKEDQGYVDSGCSKHMTRIMSYLSDFKKFYGGYVTFRGGAKGGRITDGKVKVVTKASVRRHLKLEDFDGINIFPTTKFFEQLALMGGNDQHSQLSPVTHPQAASTGVDVRHGGAATIITSLDAGQGSGNINKTLSMPYDSPLLRVHTLRSDESRMQHDELMDLVTKLSDSVVALETDLKQTKKVYGAAYTKLIMKVKKLEKSVKTSQARRKAKNCCFL
nr:hypothetical protein [Tanacetum cinerariifolium]